MTAWRTFKVTAEARVWLINSSCNSREIIREMKWNTNINWGNKSKKKMKKEKKNYNKTRMNCNNNNTSKKSVELDKIMMKRWWYLVHYTHHIKRILMLIILVRLQVGWWHCSTIITVDRNLAVFRHRLLVYLWISISLRSLVKVNHIHIISSRHSSRDHQCKSNNNWKEWGGGVMIVV